MFAVNSALIPSGVKSRTSYVTVPVVPATAGYQTSTLLPAGRVSVVTPTGNGPGSWYAWAASAGEGGALLDATDEGVDESLQAAAEHEHGRDRGRAHSGPGDHSGRRA